jgi:flagellar assembly factor FliW
MSAGTMTQAVTDEGVPDLPELVFPRGLVGFPDRQRFMLTRWGGEDSFFSVLHSLDQPGLDFVVVPPGLFFGDYAPEIDDDVASRLELEDAADALLLVLVTVAAKVEESTANLLGPLVVNLRTLQGGQAVLSPDRFSPRQSLIAGTSRLRS